MNVRVTFPNNYSSRHVKVYSGRFGNHSVDTVHCGKDSNVTAYVRNHEAYVTFTSDSTVSGTGFTATWEETVPVPGEQKTIFLFYHS